MRGVAKAANGENLLKPRREIRIFARVGLNGNTVPQKGCND